MIRTFRTSETLGREHRCILALPRHALIFPAPRPASAGFSVLESSFVIRSVHVDWL